MSLVALASSPLTELLAEAHNSRTSGLWFASCANRTMPISILADRSPYRVVRTRLQPETSRTAFWVAAGDGIAYEPAVGTVADRIAG